MKRNNILLIAPLLAGALASCGGAASSSAVDADLANALASIKGVSHTATLTQEVYVNQTFEDSIDGYIKTEATNVYSYASDGERAYQQSEVQYFADLDKGTHDIQKDEDGNEIISKYDYGTELYFREAETGTVISESIDATNTITAVYQSEYDYSAGTYSPLIFDETFRNPFDYIEARDFTKVNQGEYTLSSDKAVFMLTCYGATAPNAVKKCTLKTANGSISSVTFEMVVEGGEGYNYTRETRFSIAYSDFGEASVLHHLQKYDNDNPALKIAFGKLASATSYKYAKDYLNEDGTTKDHIQGYFTPEASFYHHHDTPEDEHVYILGDDYDYMAVRDSTGIYYGYQWSAGELPATCGQIVLSESAYYTIEDFQGLGPLVHTIDPAIFKLKDGTTDTYVLEDDKLSSSIAHYFDFQFLGVNSQILETRTYKFELVLASDGSFVVHTGYRYSDSGHTVTQDIDYTFDATSVGNTELPSYILPLPTPHPMA